MNFVTLMPVHGFGVGVVMEFPELDAIRRVYANGENVTDYLKTKLNLDENTLEVIEMAYDLQAGSYINFLNTTIITT